MRKYACPSCGADILIYSSASVSAVCDYCRALVVRHDLEVELLGTVAELPEDMSPFQLGSQGIYEGTAFTLIGRMRLGWADGYWNEWFFSDEGGRKGWLAEAQGTFALSHEVTDVLHPATQKVIDQIVMAKTGSSTAEGRYVTFKGQEFRLTDRKSTFCYGSEGELPILAPRGRKTICLDFMGGQDEFASIEAYEGKYRLYLGRYIEWDALKISHGREIEGWS